MPNPFKKVKTGDRQRIPADAYNRFLDTADAVERSRLTGGAVPAAGFDTALVTVRNDGETALPRFGVCKLVDSVVEPTAQGWKDGVWMTAEPPDGGDAVFAITLEPIPPGHAGKAVVAGVVCVQIDVTDEAHQYANPNAGDVDMLGSDTSGVPVLWKESGTGEKWAYVLLRAGAAGSLTVDTVDGVPSYTCSTLRFDEADGVSISQPAAGVVRVDIAAASYFNVGIVDTTTQGFGGRKIFYDGVQVKADYTSNAQATFGYYSTYNWFGAVFHGAGDWVSGVIPDAAGVAMKVKSAGGNTGIIGITPHTATISTTDSLGSISANTTLIVHGYYAVVPVGGSQQTGQDGTVLSGSTASGGIITALGNGNTDYGTW